MDSLSSLLGLALRAGRLAVGEEPVGAACRNHKAYLLLLARDAADNTIRRAGHFTRTGTNTICLTIPMTKADLGACLGRGVCAMLAVTDVGFAAAAAGKLAEADPAAYGAAYDALRQRAQRTNRRRKKTKEQENSKKQTRREKSPRRENTEYLDRKPQS